MIIAFSLSCSGNILCGVGKDNQSRQVMPPGPVIALTLWPLAIVYSEFQLSRILLFPTRSSYSYSKNKLMKQTYLSTLLYYFVNCCCFCGFGLPVACRPAMRSAVCVWALIAVMFANLGWLKPNNYLYQVNLVVYFVTQITGCDLLTHSSTVYDTEKLNHY